MAVVKTIEVRADTQQAEQALNNLETSLEGVGNEAKETTREVKSIGDNGGAIATLDRLTGGLASTIRDAFEATKSFNISLRGTRAALLATGIGAVVVAVGLLIEYWDEVVELVTGTNRLLERQAEINKTISDNLATQVTDGEKFLTLIEKGSDSYVKQLEAIRLIKLERLEFARLDVVEAQRQLARIKNSNIELTLWERLVIARAGGVLTPAQVEAEQRRAQLIEEQKLVIQEAISAYNDLAISIAQTNIELDEIANPDRTDEIKKQQQAILDARKAEINDFIKFNQDSVDTLNAQTDQYLADDLGRRREGADAVQKLEEEVVRTREENLNAVGFAAQGLSQLLGEQTAAGKALAVADATIQTYLGANKAIGQGGIFGIASAVGIIATGLANVQRILSIDIPGQGGTTQGLGIAGADTGGFNAPSFNIVEGSDTNQIVEGLNQQEPARAFVVSSDVSSSQELDRNIVQSSRLG